MYALFRTLISEHRRLEHRDGAGRERAALSRVLFFLPSSRSRYRTNSKHARTYATHTHAIHIESVTEYTGERRMRLASVDRGALDQQPSRGSGIAATKRERTRPLVFIRVPHYRLARLSLSLSRRIPHPKSRRTRVQEDTHEIWRDPDSRLGTRRNLYITAARL